MYKHGFMPWKIFYIKFTRNRKYSSVNWSLFQIREGDKEWKQNSSQGKYYLHHLHIKFQGIFCLHFILSYLCIPALIRKLLLAFTKHTRKGEGRQGKRKFQDFIPENLIAADLYIYTVLWLISPTSYYTHQNTSRS